MNYPGLQHAHHTCSKLKQYVLAILKRWHLRSKTGPLLIWTLDPLLSGTLTTSLRYSSSACFQCCHAQLLLTRQPNHPYPDIFRKSEPNRCPLTISSMWNHRPKISTNMISRLHISEYTLTLTLTQFSLTLVLSRILSKATMHRPQDIFFLLSTYWALTTMQARMLSIRHKPGCYLFRHKRGCYLFNASCWAPGPTEHWTRYKRGFQLTSAVTYLSCSCLTFPMIVSRCSTILWQN